MDTAYGETGRKGDYSLKEWRVVDWPNISDVEAWKTYVSFSLRKSSDWQMLSRPFIFVSNVSSADWNECWTCDWAAKL